MGCAQTHTGKMDYGNEKMPPETETRGKIKL